jgi:hypothetical protein
MHFLNAAGASFPAAFIIEQKLLILCSSCSIMPALADALVLW